ncbi:hypothetical protein ASG60_18295 [Methylobacterium sp. Leaf469]|uniref:hypothetical protein n=1 Tax=Methylobacterium sp. Leaf469 TaxID=1736387 RepID=UPI0006F4DCB5|nr:hypothetical protein [Methylobacterium sp. Leaf469]KQU01804.1 hypothetical protein ASG60_18295 [Methylobacterium sp. Leaf469]
MSTSPSMPPTGVVQTGPVRFGLNRTTLAPVFEWTRLPRVQDVVLTVASSALVVTMRTAQLRLQASLPYARAPDLGTDERFAYRLDVDLLVLLAQARLFPEPAPTDTGVDYAVSMTRVDDAGALACLVRAGRTEIDWAIAPAEPLELEVAPDAIGDPIDPVGLRDVLGWLADGREAVMPTGGGVHINPGESCARTGSVWRFVDGGTALPDLGRLSHAEARDLSRALRAFPADATRAISTPTERVLAAAGLSCRLNAGPKGTPIHRPALTGPRVAIDTASLTPRLTQLQGLARDAGGLLRLELDAADAPTLTCSVEGEGGRVEWCWPVARVSASGAVEVKPDDRARSVFLQLGHISHLGAVVRAKTLELEFLAQGLKVIEVADTQRIETYVAAAHGPKTWNGTPVVLLSAAPDQTQNGSSDQASASTTELPQAVPRLDDAAKPNTPSP